MTSGKFGLLGHFLIIVVGGEILSSSDSTIDSTAGASEHVSFASLAVAFILVYMGLILFLCTVKCLAESNYILIAGIERFHTKSVHNEV